MDGEDEYKWAKKRVEEIRGFIIHVCVFFGVIAMLTILNVITAKLPLLEGLWWFYWVAIFWGFAIMWHAIGVFVFSRALGKKWEEKEIKRLIEDKKR
jgi:energy-coupling factor transporter transmembrane protein EcfT